MQSQTCFQTLRKHVVVVVLTEAAPAALWPLAESTESEAALNVITHPTLGCDPSNLSKRCMLKVVLAACSDHHQVWDQLQSKRPVKHARTQGILESDSN